MLTRRRAYGQVVKASPSNSIANRVTASRSDRDAGRVGGWRRV
jgi:hypothetical protein